MGTEGLADAESSTGSEPNSEVRSVGRIGSSTSAVISSSSLRSAGGSFCREEEATRGESRVSARIPGGPRRLVCEGPATDCCRLDKDGLPILIAEEGSSDPIGFRPAFLRFVEGDIVGSSISLFGRLAPRPGGPILTERFLDSGSGSGSFSVNTGFLFRLRRSGS